jgi:hypothetical protein
MGRDWIHAKFAENGHIDPELYRIFVETGVYLDCTDLRGPGTD